MPNSISTAALGRAPQRSNGIKRREAILRAAEEIISEAGVAGLSLHATARRAKSSIGSMYHFFSDKDHLLDALRDRHRKAMIEIMDDVAVISSDEWKRMSTPEVIGGLFGRPMSYYSDHPFALELHQLHEGQAVDAFLLLVENVMKIRLGDAHAHRAAKMLYAVSTGTLSFILGVRDAGQRTLIANIPAVLTAYLAKQETEIDELDVS